MFEKWGQLSISNSGDAQQSNYADNMGDRPHNPNDGWGHQGKLHHRLDQRSSSDNCGGKEEQFDNGWGQHSNFNNGSGNNSNVALWGNQNKSVSNENNNNNNSWDDGWIEQGKDNDGWGCGNSNQPHPEAWTTNSPVSYVQSKSHQSKQSGPETALAIFHYEFSSHPVQGYWSHDIFKVHPAKWPQMFCQNRMQQDWQARLGFSLGYMAHQDNGAANLLLAIFWSSVLQDEGQSKAFWIQVREQAVERLFNFAGAPEQYLDWVQNIKRKNKGCLDGIISNDGQAFFTINIEGTFTWLSDLEGHAIASNVIGRLPTVQLELI